MNLIGTYPDTEQNTQSSIHIASLASAMNPTDPAATIFLNQSILPLLVFSRKLYMQKGMLHIRKCIDPKGYYESINNMVCYTCLRQCSDCNINTVMDLTNDPEDR